MSTRRERSAWCVVYKWSHALRYCCRQYLKYHQGRQILNSNENLLTEGYSWARKIADQLKYCVIKTAGIISFDKID